MSEEKRKLTISGDGKSDDDWRKLLYYHSVRVTQAKTQKDLQLAVQALRAVRDAAKAVGYKPGQAQAAQSDESPMERAARIVREGSDLRDDQLVSVDGEES